MNDRVTPQDLGSMTTNGLAPVPQQNDATHNKFNHSINIEPLNRGFVIRVGCQSIAFETKEKMLKYLSEYLSDPNSFEAKYRAGEVLGWDY